MLKLHQVSKTFNPGTINEKKALKSIDLHLKPGDFVTVIGGNGAGKSTMLNAVAGVWPVDDGSVVIDGTDVTGMPEHVRAKYIGRVFQDPMTGTAPNMQIEENLALASRRGPDAAYRAQHFEQIAFLRRGETRKFHRVFLDGKHRIQKYFLPHGRQRRKRIRGT